MFTCHLGLGSIVVKRAGQIIPLLICICLFGGCSGGGDTVDRLATVPASGTLTIDGTAFGPGTLDFIPVEQSGDRFRAASAAIEEGGRFSVRTYEEGDGIVPGSYTVKVSVPLESASPAPNVEYFELTVGAAGDTNIAIDLKTKKGNEGTLLSPNLQGGGASTDL